MAISKSAAAGLAAAFIVGGVAGGAAGWHYGAVRLLNHWVQEQADDVRGDIAVLRQLRGGNASQAAEMLESRLDDDLIRLVPEGYPLGKETSNATAPALGEAKQYRAEHPRRSKRAFVDEMVRNVLK